MAQQTREPLQRNGGMTCWVNPAAVLDLVAQGLSAISKHLHAHEHVTGLGLNKRMLVVARTYRARDRGFTG